MSNKDKPFFCERCGISFLWTIEEQRQLERTQSSFIDGQSAVSFTKKPTHCAGCRHLLPADGRIRGVVKWYNPRKRYGFIVSVDGPEIFAHGLALMGAKRLVPGDLVEFAIETDEQRSKAVDIEVLQKQSSKAIPKK